MNNNEVQSSTSSFGSTDFKEFPVERFNKPKSFGYKLGSFFASAILTTITLCIIAAAIAGTCKFIMWLF